MANLANVPERVKALFTDAEHPCYYCGATPTLNRTVVPAEYVKSELTQRATIAWLCFTCCQRLRLLPGAGLSTSERLANRRAREASDRREVARALKQLQGSLFEPSPPTPANPITKG